MSSAAPDSAPAKLTLSLRVLGLRDDGFHDLEALTISIDAPADQLTFAAAPPGEVRLTLSGATDGVPAGPDNLVVRAARSVLPSDAGVAIALRKQIPPGAGLGGGSSDAACVLRSMRDRLGVDPGVVERAAAALGSDVPYCLHGGPAWMRGRGEVLEPIELAAPVHVLVVVPPFGLSTPSVYRAWDELGGPHAARVVAAPAGVAGLSDGLANDLEPAAARVEPRWVAFRDALESTTGTPALLAGSGSACWLAFDDPEACRTAAAKVRSELELTAYRGVSL